jgi:anti-anti-sigma factor
MIKIVPPDASSCAPRAFRIVENSDGDGVLRLQLLGELDLSVAAALRARLMERIEDGHPTRLDLSRLEFIDSSGISVLIRVVQAAGRVDRALIEIDRTLGSQVKRTIDLVGVGEILWPK